MRCRRCRHWQFCVKHVMASNMLAMTCFAEPLQGCFAVFGQCCLAHGNLVIKQ